MMKDKLPTLVLRLIIFLCVAAGVLMCIFALPPFGTAVAKNFPDYAFWQYPILAGLYGMAVCFFFGLLQFWLLLNGIDKNKTLSVKNLKAIRLSAIVFSILYYLSVMPVVYLYADADDAPGLILIAAFWGTLPIGIAAFSVILKQISGGKNT
jgi:hypothetical protein